MLMASGAPDRACKHSAPGGMVSDAQGARAGGALLAVRVRVRCVCMLDRWILLDLCPFSAARCPVPGRILIATLLAMSAHLPGGACSKDPGLDDLIWDSELSRLLWHPSQATP